MPKFMPSANWALPKTSGPEMVKQILSEIAAESRTRAEAKMDRILSRTANPDSWTYDPFRTNRPGYRSH